MARAMLGPASTAQPPSRAREAMVLGAASHPRPPGVRPWRPLVLRSGAIALVLSGVAGLSLAVDLQVARIERPTLPGGCDALEVGGTVRVTVANRAAGTAAGGFDVLVFEDLDRSGTWDGGVTDALLGTARFSEDLGAGAVRQLDVPVAGELSLRDAALSALVDAADEVAESDEANNVADNAARCQARTPAEFTPVLEWAWEADRPLSTPMVGDVDGDGWPDVAFVGLLGRVFVLDGRDGTDIWSAAGAGREANVALADLDGDPGLEVIVPTTDRLRVFDGDGTVLFDTSPATRALLGVFGAPSVADIDCDGEPEFVVGPDVFRSSDGSLFWTPEPGGTVGASGYGGSISVPVDLDGDGIMEVVAGPTAYRLDEVTGEGRILWQRPEYSDGLTAVGELDGDDGPEVVLVTREHLVILDSDGDTLLELERPASGEPCTGSFNNGGAPTIADFDGDGAPEIGVAGSYRYAVFEVDGSLLWESPTQDCSSSATGSTVFDFDNDGSAEVVYRDEAFLRVYRGSDGAVLVEIPAPSATSQELPVVADCDADGQAEILVSVMSFGGSLEQGIRVYGDREGNWVETRRLWHQHAYHVTEIDDEGVVPGPDTGCEPPSWLLHGSYRRQLGSPERLPGPDLSLVVHRQDLVTESSCRSLLDLAVRVGNAGAAPVEAGLELGIWQGDPASGGTRLESVPVPPLEPGAFVDVERVLPVPAGALELHLVADDDGTGTGDGLLLECREDNNACVVEAVGGEVALPARLGPVLRARSHGDPHSALVEARFDWIDDPALPRPAGEHYHVRRGRRPTSLAIVSDDSGDATALVWDDVTPATPGPRGIHYLRVVAANACEVEE